MKTIKRLLTLGVLPAAMSLGLYQSAYALQLTGIDMKPVNGASEVRLNFDSAVSQPRGFVLKNPPRLVLDIPKASMGYAIPKHQPGVGVINKVDIVEAGRRVRLTFRLSSETDYTTRIEGNQLVVKLSSNGGATRQKRAIPPSSANVLATLPEVPAPTSKRAGIIQPQKDIRRSTPARPAPRPAMRPKTPVRRANTSDKQKQWVNRVVKKNPNLDRDMAAAMKLLESDSKRARMAPKPKPGMNIPRPTTKLAYNHGTAMGTTKRLGAVTTPELQMQRQQAMARESYQSSRRNLGHVDFRRDSAGNGRVIINLPDNSVETSENQNGNIISLLIKGVKYPQGQRRLDVVDFGTPVNYVNIIPQGADTKVQIAVAGNYKYDIAKAGDGKVMHVNVKKASKKLTPEDLVKKKKVYKGEKLTLNFQDIEVRSVLQLLADFTNKNIVVSDSVKGNITLRLKDVPWDQALDIVLSSKALAMRKNGNVIWVAPSEELAAREQRELDELQKKKKHESLVTEYIPINFAKGEEITNLIRSKTGEDARSLLSPRGSITVDNRTNTLLVQDTADRVEQIRSLVKVLDVPVRQVAIESRIVIADDNFSKDLGSRFGVSGLVSFNGDKGLLTNSGSANATSGIVSDAAGNLSSSGSVFPVSVPSLNDRLNVNLPAAGSAGSFGFSLLSQNFLVDLELSALQAENKGEIISTPRVVTANQSKATIEQGVEVPYQQASSSGATNVAFKKAVLSLEVTPQITPEEHVIMDLKINQDTVGNVVNNVPSINTREIQTKILVNNGQTVVLGGIHEEESRNGVEKVPVLGDLPVVGKLFKRTTRKNDKRELLIFVTPKILE